MKEKFLILFKLSSLFILHCIGSDLEESGDTIELVLLLNVKFHFCGRLYCRYSLLMKFILFLDCYFSFVTQSVLFFFWLLLVLVWSNNDYMHCTELIHINTHLKSFFFFFCLLSTHFYFGTITFIYLSYKALLKLSTICSLKAGLIVIKTCKHTRQLYCWGTILDTLSALNCNYFYLIFYYLSFILLYILRFHIK